HQRRTTTMYLGTEQLSIIEALLETRYDALRELLRQTHHHETEHGRKEIADQLLDDVRRARRVSAVPSRLRRRFADVVAYVRRRSRVGRGREALRRHVEHNVPADLVDLAMQEAGFGTDDLPVVREATPQQGYAIPAEGRSRFAFDSQAA